MTFSEFYVILTITFILLQIEKDVNIQMRLYDAYIFDLDGTVFLGDTLLPTAGETLATLRDLRRQIVFLSNNPTRTRETYVTKLNRLGVPVTADDIIHSSLVMANFLQRRMPGARLFVVGEEPLKTELQAAGFVLSEEPDQIDAVIASFDRTFEYRKLQIAFDAIRAGARFFATNGDRYCPVPGGGEPDSGRDDRGDRGLHGHDSRSGRRQALDLHDRGDPGSFGADGRPVYHDRRPAGDRRADGAQRRDGRRAGADRRDR